MVDKSDQNIERMAEDLYRRLLKRESLGNKHAKWTNSEEFSAAVTRGSVAPGYQPTRREVALPRLDQRCQNPR